MINFIKQKISEALVLKLNKPKNELVVISDLPNERDASGETYRNKEKLKADRLFNWDGELKAWVTSTDNFEKARTVLNGLNKSGKFIEKIEDLQDFVIKAENFDGKQLLLNKLSTYVNDLANATDEKVMSAEIRRYLTFFAKFKSHSFSNTILIYIQRPDATKVAGFSQWEKFHRKVKKGAKGIMIFAPVFDKKNKTANEPEMPDDGQLDKEVLTTKTPVNFRPVYVFDISDTEAIDSRGEAPEQPQWFLESEPTERTKELFEITKAAIENMGIKVTSSDPHGKERGYSSGDHINMTSSVAGAGELSTLFHEWAHELMHWKKTSLFYQGDDIKTSAAIKELQAESVAYVMMKHFQLDVQHQPTYIALWRGNKDKILDNLKVISNVSNFMIGEINKMANGKKIDEELFL